MQEAQKINSLSEDNLLLHTTNEIYNKLNNLREMIQVSKFYRDDAAELAIKDYFFANNTTEQELDQKLKEVKHI
jgi:hypothetical protein